MVPEHWTVCPHCTGTTFHDPKDLLDHISLFHPEKLVNEDETEVLENGNENDVTLEFNDENKSLSDSLALTPADHDPLDDDAENLQLSDLFDEEGDSLAASATDDMLVIAHGDVEQAADEELVYTDVTILFFLYLVAAEILREVDVTSSSENDESQESFGVGDDESQVTVGDLTTVSEGDVEQAADEELVYTDVTILFFLYLVAAEILREVDVTSSSENDESQESYRVSDGSSESDYMKYLLPLDAPEPHAVSGVDVVLRDDLLVDDEDTWLGYLIRNMTYMVIFLYNHLSALVHHLFNLIRNVHQAGDVEVDDIVYVDDYDIGELNYPDTLFCSLYNILTQITRLEHHLDIGLPDYLDKWEQEEILVLQIQNLENFWEDFRYECIQLAILWKFIHGSGASEDDDEAQGTVGGATRD